MNNGNLNWLRFSMISLLLFTAFAVGWNLWADIKINNPNKYSQNVSPGNYEFTSSQAPLYSEVKQTKGATVKTEDNRISLTPVRKFSKIENKNSISKTPDLALDTNPPTTDSQTDEVATYAGLIASISDVMGYSIPFEDEIFAYNELFAKHKGAAKKKYTINENPETPESQEPEQGIVIKSSEKDGVKVEDAWYNGVNVVKAHRGMNVMHAYGDGVNINLARNDGFNVDSAEVNGLDIDHVGDDGVQIFRAGKDGLVIYSAGEEGIDAIGDMGNLLRSNSPNYHGLYVQSYGSSPKNPGLYVAGTFYATGTKSSVVKTSKGNEALYAMESPEVEFLASGTGKLVNGKCYVIFDRLFQEAISSEVPLRIILTPKETWSGLYVAQKSYQGFQVKAKGGEENAEFDWLAIGRRKGYEKRPDSFLPK
ncbi:MAG: hypothetical protein WBD28_02970 [Candidatus Zixiibacteriota bacterium]